MRHLFESRLTRDAAPFKDTPHAPAARAAEMAGG
jgi:hypothetical protein